MSILYGPLMWHIVLPGRCSRHDLSWTICSTTRQWTAISRATRSYTSQPSTPCQEARQWTAISRATRSYTSQPSTPCQEARRCGHCGHNKRSCTLDSPARGWCVFILEGLRIIVLIRFRAVTSLLLEVEKLCPCVTYLEANWYRGYARGVVNTHVDDCLPRWVAKKLF